MTSADVRLIAEGRTAEIYSWEPGQVLKLYRPEFQADLPEFELSIMRAVLAAGIPAPEVGKIVLYNGRKGLPMAHIQGDSHMVGLRTHLWQAAIYGKALAELHARMHTASGAGLPPMRERLESKIRHAEPLPEKLRAAALAALKRLPENDRLCHGDFHPGNIIESPEGPVIIDWVDVTSGEPLADVARTALLVRYAALPSGNPMNLLIEFVRGGFYKAYLTRYFELAPGSQSDVDAWLPVVAAARLSEGISREERSLLAMAARLEER